MKEFPSFTPAVCPPPDDAFGTGAVTRREPIQISTDSAKELGVGEISAENQKIQRIKESLRLSQELGEPLRGTFQSFGPVSDYREEIVVWMTAQGMNCKTIATKLGISTNAVSQCMNRPGFRQKVRAAIQESGKDQLTATLEAEVLPSIETLIQVRDNEAEKGATRVQAANSILDRFLGKPVAKVETETRITDRQASAEIDGLKQELAQVESQLKAVGVQTTN